MPAIMHLPQIVLIEDDPGDIRLFKEAMSECSEPADILDFTNPLEALAHLARLALDRQATLPVLIVTDLNMPRRSGYEVIATIRSQERLEDIPIVVLSSSHRASDVSASLKAGAIAFLSKPKDWEGFRDLVPNVRSYWGRKPASQRPTPRASGATRGRSILLVEDNRGDAHLFNEAVAQCSMSVDVTVLGDVDLAIAHLSGLGAEGGPPLPDLIITDLALGARSGSELVDHVKSTPALRQVPILVLSAAASPAEIAACHKLGADGYLVKPNRWAEYVDLVTGLTRTWLRRRRA